jgi:hypothetical protein
MKEKVKGISRALSIVAKIIKVFMIIGVVGAAIGMITIPLVANNITFTENIEEEKSDSLIIISQKDDKISVKIGENIVVADASVEEYKGLSELFNSQEKTKYVWYAEFGLAIAIAMLVLFYFVMQYVDKFFNSIYENETPFAAENPMYIRKMAYLLTAYLVVSLIGSGLYEIITNRSMESSVGLLSVMFVLSLYVFAYVFEYGYEIEHKKAKK